MKVNRVTSNVTRALSAILLTGVVVGLGALTTVSVSASPAGQSQSDIDKLKGLTGEQFEKEFLSMMIQHHQSAVEMSKSAAQNANHQEVKDIAQKITSDQTKEITDMTGWLKTWYNATPMPNAMGEMAGMGMSDMMSLQSLKGDEFDKQYLTMMRMHHMSAVEMAQLVSERATHQELKTLAQNIISSQTTEIGQFESWLKTWYSIDASQMGSMSGGSMSGGSMSGGSAPSEIPNTGGGSGAMLAPWLILAVALAGSALLGGLMLRRRS